MIKKLILLVLAIGAAYGALLSPYSYKANENVPQEIKQVQMELSDAEVNSVKAREEMHNAKATFDNNHSFDVAYNDLSKLSKLLSITAGISVSGMSAYDPVSQMEIGPYDPESGAELPAAILMKLVVDDINGGLRVVNRLELPVISLTVNEPGNIDVIFLTGGDIDA